MDIFLYKVTDNTGRVLYGISEAASLKDVKKQFRSTEFYFVSAKPYDIRGLSRITLKLDDLLMFTHRFSYLIEAGLPILSALQLLWRQSNDKDVQIISSWMRKKLEEGGTLYEAFNYFPGVFPVLYRALITVAEVGVGLVTVLTKLRQYLEEQKHFVARLRKATMYPLFVLGFAFLVMVGMFVFVVPTFQKVILKLHGDLPIITQFIFFTSSLLRNGWFIGFVFLFTLGGFFSLRYLRKVKKFKYWFDSLIFKTPIVRDVLYPLTIGRFTRSLSLLVLSGVPLLRAIEVSKATIVNVPIELALDEIRRQLVEGGSMYEAFRSTKVFPLLLVEMVGIGESSGRLAQLLEKAAIHLEEEADYAITKFLTLLEPLLIICIGGMVLFILLGIYLPIFAIQDGLRTL